MANDLRGKTILVTGAAKRIGRAIALRLAEEGARVAIHFRSSEAEARRTAEECRRRGAVPREPGKRSGNRKHVPPGGRTPGAPGRAGE